MLENVDRLLSSPAKCRGRDFAIILASLNALGYDVEWRVINAADYGFPQRRRRIFIVAHHRASSAVGSRLNDPGAIGAVPPSLLLGTLNRAFPCTARSQVKTFGIPTDVFEAQELFGKSGADERPFLNAGVLLDGKVFTQEVKAAEIADFSAFSGHQQALTLGDVVSATPPESIDPSFFLGSESASRWTYLKGAKAEPRTSSSGHTYQYKEGPLPFPDPLDRPSRTIITSEGGATASRTKHVVADSDGRLRRLTPEELEALNGFPRGFTQREGVSPVTRAFLMGNALVVGVVRRIGESLNQSG
jgi:DNA (cytosine-5)-methyltransferase 1